MIFGTQNPKIVDSDDNDILLDHSVVLADEPEYDQVIHESDLDGTVYFAHKGKHWNYEIRYHIFKESDQATKFQALYDLLDEEVTLYRHRDKDPFKDSSGTIVPFVLTEIIPIYMETVSYRDALILKFTSTKYVDLSESLTAHLVTEDGESIITEDGEEILIE
jgi:hypothetical protein